MCFKVLTRWRCGHVSPQDPNPYEKCDKQARTFPCSKGFVDWRIKVKFVCAACKSQEEQRDRIVQQRKEAREAKSKERWAAERAEKKMKVERNGAGKAKRKGRHTPGKETNAFRNATTPPTSNVTETVRLNQTVIDSAQRPALKRETGLKRKRDHEKMRNPFAVLFQDAPRVSNKTNGYGSAFDSSPKGYEYDVDEYGFGDYGIKEDSEGFEGDGDGFVHYRPG